MTTLPVSLAEISREGPWALRALGYSFFIADRATRLLVWTEAVHQLGLKFLHLGDPGIRKAANGQSTLEREKRDGVLHINAQGRCVLDVGPPAMDLATMEARKDGYAHIMIRGVTGLCLAEALSEVALNRNLGFTFVYASGDQEIGKDSLSRSGWLAGTKYSDQPVLFGSAKDEWAHTSLETFATQMFAENNVIRTRFIADNQTALEQGTTGFGYLAITLFQSDRTIASTDMTVDDDLGLLRVDYAERMLKAQKHGVIADLADLKHLYELEYETWAPTSERSKQQAGF
jgi:hypothetical protein